MAGPAKRLSLFVWLRRSLLLVAIAIALAWFGSKPNSPDSFYELTLPANATPGELLKSEPFLTHVPDGARGWRILYVTTRKGTPVVASAVVVVPVQPADQPRPMIAWAHGTTGVVAGCAPSVMGKPFDNLPDIAAVVAEGWAYVGADYPGLGTDGGHAYLVGEDAARAVLDSVRAAQHLREAGVGTNFVVWGHSQGGNSALWTGVRAASLAPDLKLLGVAALAPASDLKALVASAQGGLFGKIVSSYLLAGYAQAYDDVKAADYVSAWPRFIAADMASRCVGGYGTLFSVAQTFLLPANGIFSRDPGTGPLGARLDENTPRGLIPVPVLIGQGEADDLVLPTVQQQYVTERCAAGQALDFRTYAGRDHVSVMAKDSPLAAELLAWTRDRFEGLAAAGNCPS